MVFLDLRQDRYFGLDETDCARLRRYVIGLSPEVGESKTSFDSISEEQPIPTSDIELLDNLLSQKLLVRASTNLRPPTRLTVKRPERALIEGYEEVQTRITCKDVIIFLRSARSVAASLRQGSMERLLTYDRRLERARNRVEFDTEYARERMVVFKRLRPLVYTESNACLFNSLAAQRYLARYRIVSSIVIGVASNPFKAHSWLQYEDLVLNDVPEYVREYTPILQVPSF